MAIPELGILTCLTNNVIHWKIPSFYLLPCEKNTRIWSPMFVYYIENVSYAIPRNGYFQTPEVSLALVITSNDVTYNQIKNVQFGVADDKYKVINRCDGKWIERSVDDGYFRISNVISSENLKCRLDLLYSKKVLLRFFCVAIDEEDRQRSTVPNQNDEHVCRRNSIEAVESLKKPVTNLPLCIICYSNERDIVFQPCGHLITCNDCSDFRLQLCPICRNQITSKIKTYIN